MIECDHIGHRVFAFRIFGDLSRHYCVQCLKCGQPVKYNNKQWLKLEDIPPNKKIHLFDDLLMERKSTPYAGVFNQPCLQISLPNT